MSVVYDVSGVTRSGAGVVECKCTHMKAGCRRYAAMINEINCVVVNLFNHFDVRLGFSSQIEININLSNTDFKVTVMTIIFVWLGFRLL